MAAANGDLVMNSREGRKLFDGGACKENAADFNPEDEEYITEKQRGFRAKFAGRLAEREGGPVLVGEEIERWGDVMCQLRYLRARSWDIDKAFGLFLGTVEWRGEYGPQLTSN